MKGKYVLLVLLSLLFAGCSTIKPVLKDPTGRLMPTPHYTLEVVGEPITVFFYYTAFEEIKDLDGSLIYKPDFLEFFTLHDIPVQKYKAITLTIEVNNPTNIEYSLYEQATLSRESIQEEIQIGSSSRRSNLDYRQFIFQLPYDDDINLVDYLVMFQINDREVLRIGNFRYHLIHE